MVYTPNAVAMAPTETMNLVIAPDLAQDELPFLKHMGFKQAFTPLSPLDHTNHARPSMSDAKQRGDARFSDDGNYDEHDEPSISGTSRESNSTALSAGSGNSGQLPSYSKAKSTKLSTGAKPGQARSTTEQELQASRIASFISRMKYLSDEGENHEFTPGIFPAGGSLTGQRSMIQTHAARVKNQLELKFQAIPYFLELEKYLDNTPGTHDRSSYNPLQIIRDRKIRPYNERHNRQNHRQVVWQIPVSEMVQDMRWRYHCTKLKAQKLKRRQKKADSFAKLEAENGSFDTAPENQHGTSNEDFLALGNTPRISQHEPQHGSHPAQPQFNDPFLTPHTRRQSQASEGPTLSLPETSCGELIQRLRSSHGVTDAGPLDGANSSSSDSRHSSFNDASDVDPLSQHQPSSFRRQFCRNVASVTDTRNRLRSFNDHTDTSRIGNVTEDDLLKPLSMVQTNNSQTFSTHSSRSSSIPEMFNFDAGSSSSVSLAADQTTQTISNPNSSSGNVTSGNVPQAPVVTITSDSGEQKLLDPLKRTPRTNNSGNLGTLKQSTPQKGSDLTQKSNLTTASASTADDSMNDSSNICTFGSIRPGHVDVRKAPWERVAHTAEEELEYHILLFKTALRREDVAQVRNRLYRKYNPQDACHIVSTQLKNEGVPRFMNYLSGVEHNVVNQQQILDADFASSLDALRVSTDRMISEVNTTLNKQVREMSSRVEKVSSARHSGFCTNASYICLEYVVLSLMWAIWCVVKLWRILYAGFHVLRGGCSMFAIA